jgi:predicted permease
VKLALRTLAKSPGFTAVAVLTLALGIGLSTSSFSLTNTFLLRNVPYPNADRLVYLFGTSREDPRGALPVGTALQLRNNVSSFESYAVGDSDAYVLGEVGQPAERVNGTAVAPNFFQVLGLQPQLGRGFLPGEDAPGRPLVAVITHDAWVRRYAADPGIIGHTITLNLQPCTIVGVLPPEFDAPLVWGPLEFFVPCTVHPGYETNFRSSWFWAVARLKPGVSLRQAQAELSTIASRLEREHPNELAGKGLLAVPLHRANTEAITRKLLWLMTGISLALLLIACANLASLQVARALGRSREFAVRAALGGRRWQLIAPLLTESLVLAGLGGIGGLLVAVWTNAVVGRMILVNGQRDFAIDVDARVFAFAVFVSLLSGLAFGLAPAWLAARSPAAQALKEGSRGATSGRSHQRLKNTLIVGELAVALALVGLASSFGIGARAFLHRGVGWEIDGLFRGYLALPYTPYSDAARNRAFQRALLDRLRQIPGVEHAALAKNLPIFAIGNATPLAIEGEPPAAPGQEPMAEVAPVSSDYFAALHIALQQGELFPVNLSEKDPPVAVINASFARRFWPNQNPIGQRVRLGDSTEWVRIIGVVADVGLLARFDAPSTRLQLYRPLIQAPNRYFMIVLRSTLAPESLTKSVRAAVTAIDPDIPVAAPASARAAFDLNLSNLNVAIANIGFSAGMSLLIAGIGLFGVISQLTQQRTRDIGVRMALGAQARDIARLIVGHGVKLLLLGIVLGVPVFFALTTILHRAMPEMRLPGLWLLAANLAALAAIMLLACWLPARRAARINPIEALRAE